MSTRHNILVVTIQLALSFHNDKIPACHECILTFSSSKFTRRASSNHRPPFLFHSNLPTPSSSVSALSHLQIVQMRSRSRSLSVYPPLPRPCFGTKYLHEWTTRRSLLGYWNWATSQTASPRIGQCTSDDITEWRWADPEPLQVVPGVGLMPYFANGITYCRDVGAERSAASLAKAIVLFFQNIARSFTSISLHANHAGLWSK